MWHEETSRAVIKPEPKKHTRDWREKKMADSIQTEVKSNWHLIKIKVHFVLTPCVSAECVQCLKLYLYLEKRESLF